MVVAMNPLPSIRIAGASFYRSCGVVGILMGIAFAVCAFEPGARTTLLYRQGGEPPIGLTLTIASTTVIAGILLLLYARTSFTFDRAGVRIKTMLMTLAINWQHVNRLSLVRNQKGGAVLWVNADSGIEYKIPVYGKRATAVLEIEVTELASAAGCDINING